MNNNEFDKVHEGFDDVMPISERSDEPIEELFKSTEEKATAETPETIDDAVVTDCGSPATDAPAQEEPPVPSYTPGVNYGYMPTGSYNNNRTNEPQTHAVYIGKPPKEPKPKREHKKHGFSSASLVALLLVVAIIGAASGIGTAFALDLFNRPAETSSSGGESIGGNTNITIDDSKVESVVEAVYEKASPSVVGIRTTVGVKNFFFGESESSGEGTGIIYSADGYIITCYHVIEEIYSDSITSSKVEVFLSNDTTKGIEADVIGFNKSTDIALLKIDKTGLLPAEFSTSDDLKVGQFAVAIGNPGGLQFMSSVSYGVISGLNRTISIEGLGEMSLIQTDAAINPGNSGGALVNTAGKVIAMNSSKLVDESFEGMGFAIPINTVLEIVDNILNNKDTEQPYLGIEYYTNITEEWLKENNLPAGVVIKSVVSGGPAENAGLRSGDIIVKFNNIDIKNAETFSAEISKCKPNQKVGLTIYRNGKYYTGNVTVGSNN